MIRERALDVLMRVADGSLDAHAALDRLALDPVESLPFATIDHNRALRQGFPEVIYAAGKTSAQTVAIADRLASRGDGFLVTRADDETRRALVATFPAAESSETARTVWLRGSEATTALPGHVLVVSAGTSDAGVAEEAGVTLTAFGARTELVADVGVAGIHRILSRRDALLEASVIIVVAGMDGALPSVIGGLVRCPVIAVPTSVGYGASFGGVAALLAMLNSCASGVTVVNIDNGFGAAVAATRILRASSPSP